MFRLWLAVALLTTLFVPPVVLMAQPEAEPPTLEELDARIRSALAERVASAQIRSVPARAPVAATPPAQPADALVRIFSNIACRFSATRLQSGNSPNAVTLDLAGGTPAEQRLQPGSYRFECVDPAGSSVSMVQDRKLSVGTATELAFSWTAVAADPTVKAEIAADPGSLESAAPGDATADVEPVPAPALVAPTPAPTAAPVETPVIASAEAPLSEDALGLAIAPRILRLRRQIGPSGTELAFGDEIGFLPGPSSESTLRPNRTPSTGMTPFVVMDVEWNFSGSAAEFAQIPKRGYLVLYDANNSARAAIPWRITWTMDEAKNRYLQRQIAFPEAMLSNALSWIRKTRASQMQAYYLPRES